MEPESHLGPMSLNFDVMQIVMSYADRKLVSSLMKTCNTLNVAGARHLLEERVPLQDKRSIESFLHFLRARSDEDECRRRLTLLKMLTFELHDRPSKALARVLEGLFETLARAAPNFTSLEISNAEALLDIYPPLGSAIAKLTTLKTLYLRGTGVYCAILLMRLQSSLITATIIFGLHGGALEFGPDDDRELEFNLIPEIHMNPMVLLKGSQPTLRSLCASSPVSSPDGPCYYNVTRLDLPGLSYMDLPFIEHYIRAFPNLRLLTTTERDGCGWLDGGYLDSWRWCRDAAKLYQAQHGTWRSLQDYCGLMFVLWIWGLTCHIPSLELSFQLLPGVDANFLHDIIEDARPSRLSLTLHGASSPLDDALRAVLSEEGRLQVLELRVIFQVERLGGDEVPIRHILDPLVDVVRASSVPTFKLTLDLTTTWMGRLWRMQGLPAEPFEEEYLRDASDVDAYADALLASAASLEEVQVSIVIVESQDRGMRRAARRRTGPNACN